jgi:arabinofuranosyltransferase
LSAPLFCAAIAISRADFSKIETTVRLQLLALTIGFGFMALHPTLMSGAPSATASLFNASTGIGDERLLTFPASGLRSVVRGTPPNELAMRQGHAARDARRPVVTSSGDLIVAAFFSGPTVHILDATGNADPLLARLSPNPSSYPGQAVRELPDGYEDAVISGSGHLTNPTLAMYHEQLTLITRGPIWSINRWRAILRMNLTHRGGLQALRVG